MKDQRLGPCVSTTYLELILFDQHHGIRVEKTLGLVPVDLDDIVPESYAPLAPWGDLKVESKG